MHWKPILTLLLITPFLTELLSGNIPPSKFFNPLGFLLLATIGYGFPVLLLREIACRNRMGVPGMICLGLFYGIINEGILAKTFYLAQGVPINLFDGYGYVAGICIPWAIFISVWHAFHAFLYPVLIAYYFFPAHREEPWLSRKGALWLAAPTVLILTLNFFGHNKARGPGQVPHFVLMLLAMGLLAWVATRIPRSAILNDEKSFRLKPALMGVLGFLVLFLAPLLLCRAKIPAPVFCGYYVLALALVFRWLEKQPALPVMTCLLFSIGDNAIFVLVGVLIAAHRGSVELMASNVLFVVAFAFLLVRLRKDARLCPAPVRVNDPPLVS